MNERQAKQCISDCLRILSYSAVDKNNDSNPENTTRLDLNFTVYGWGGNLTEELVDETEETVAEENTGGFDVDEHFIIPLDLNATVPSNDRCPFAHGPLPISNRSIDGSTERLIRGTTLGATKKTIDRCGVSVTGPSVWFYGTT
jgi:hypothetical protein